MTAYAVFEPPAGKRAGRRAGAAPTDRFVFVRDAFTWGAFLLGPLWMAWRRLWLSLFLYVAVLALLTLALRALSVPAGAWAAVAALIALLLGLEGASLRRWTLARRGWRERGTVVADDLESAERRFFDAFVAARTAEAAGNATSSEAGTPAEREAATAFIAAAAEPAPASSPRMPAAANLPPPSQLPSTHPPSAAPEAEQPSPAP